MKGNATRGFGLLTSLIVGIVVLTWPALAAAEEPRYGGTLTVGRTADVISFDPVVPTDNMSIWAMLLIYDQLVRVNRDATGVEPSLAESWDVSEDGLSYTFHLRKGVKFHDGTPLTARDVKFSIDRAATGKESSWTFLFGALQETKVVDEYTFVCVLKTPFVPFLADLSLFGASIIPAHAVQELGEDFTNRPIGTGPFRMVEWKKGQEIILRKFEDHWREGLPYLDEVRLQVISDDNTRILNVLNGTIDIATFVPYNNIDMLKTNPDIDMQVTPLAKIDLVYVNSGKPPFDDVKVRQAMNYAIDKQAIISSVLFGYGTVATSYLPDMMGMEPTIEGYPYDLEKAKALMAESAHAEGIQVPMLVNSGSEEYKQVAVILKEQLKEIGIDLELQLVEEGTMWQMMSEGNYHLSPSYYTTDIVDPDELTILCTVYDGGANSLYTFFNGGEEYNNLAWATQTETDPAKRQEMFNKLQRMNLELAQFIYLYRSPSKSAVRKHVKNFEVLLTGNYRLEEVWLEK